MSRGYGNQECVEPTFATAGKDTSSNNLAAATAGVYYWTNQMGKAVVVNYSADDLFVVWNDIMSDPTTTSSETPTAATTKWHEVVSAGSRMPSPDGVMIKSIGLYSAAGATYKTNFSVYAWE
jgi:hypothetical protein